VRHGQQTRLIYRKITFQGKNEPKSFRLHDLKPLLEATADRRGVFACLTEEATR
jgi:hypothetical protein